VIGELKATGIRPQFSPRLEAAGFKLGADVFGSTIAEMLASRQRR
jgi:pilus assembly protein CpaF